MSNNRIHILVPDAQSFHGGVETVTTQIIQAWTKDPRISVTWVLPPNRLEAFQTEFADNQNLEFESFQWRRSHPRSWLLSFFRRIHPSLCSMWERKCNSAKLQSIIKKRSCTHCFYFWTLEEPYPFLSIPIYCFIHDLAWKVVPESYPGRNLKRLDESVMDWVRSSHCVFTNSNQTREEVLGMLPSMSNKVHAVLLAATNQPESTRPPLEEFPIQESEPFFLYPSAANPQKNHIVLFKAVLDLLARGLRFKLVLTGGQTEQLLGEAPMERKAPEEARRFFHKHKEHLSGTIIAAGHVSERMLTALFNKCIAILMPSKYEGFGLPVAEAFSYGKPVIASNLAVFREQITCYDADEFVETFTATDHETLAGLMRSRLQEGELSPERMQELQNKTAKWKWEDVAKGYVRFMQQSDRSAAIA